MKAFTFKVKTSEDGAKETDLDKIVGAPIATLHSMSSYKQDDLTAVVTIFVTLGEGQGKEEG